MSEVSSRECGVLYAGTGEVYRQEIIRSIQSLRNVMPDIPVAVFSDKPIEAESDGIEFHFIEEPEHGFMDKVRCFRLSPFRKTLFLDTDTFVVEPLDELFALLDQFDLLGAHDSSRENGVMQPMPDAFPEINTGVLCYRSCEAVESLFRDVEELFEPVSKSTGDQTAFRVALLRSKVRIWVLPPEYNCQIRQVGFLGQSVKILHGRNMALSWVAKRLNRKPTRRVFIPSPLFGGTRIISFSRFKLKAWSAIWLMLERLGLLNRER